ncbi:hypothetical protein D3C72_979240 [compost metagenome]
MLFDQGTVRFNVGSILDIRFLHRFRGTIDIQVIGIHSRQYCYIRFQLQEAAVIFVCFYHCYCIVGAPVVSIIIYRNAAQKCITAITAISQYVTNHSADCRFAVGTGNSDGKHRFCNPLQCIRALVHRVIISAVPVQDYIILWYGRCIDHDIYLFLQFCCCISISDTNLFLHELTGKIGFCFIITVYLHASLLEEAGQGAHAYTSYTYKIYFLY